MFFTLDTFLPPVKLFLPLFSNLFSVEYVGLPMTLDFLPVSKRAYLLDLQTFPGPVVSFERIGQKC